MLYGWDTVLSQNLVDFLSLPMIVFLLVVLWHIPDNDRSQFIQWRYKWKFCSFKYFLMILITLILMILMILIINNLFFKTESYFWTSHLFALFCWPVTQSHWGQFQNLFCWSIAYFVLFRFYLMRVWYRHRVLVATNVWNLIFIIVF